jgi:hypothetical protein
MEWIVKIEGKLNQRILVKFDPQNEQLIFIGQCKLHNLQWTNFSQISKSIWIIYPDIISNTTSNVGLISLEIIQNTLSGTYELMKKRYDAYNEIAEGFAHIKLIEIVGDSVTEDEKL